MSNKRFIIIPQPKKAVFNDSNIKISCTGVSSIGGAYIGCFAAFASLAEKIYGVNLAFGGDGIRLHSDPNLSGEEYKISVTEEGANVYAGGEDGISRALATLLQICECDGDFAIKLPLCDIEDRPDCDYRALMIDLARKWHPFDTLLGYVDLCYLYKIKYLHLHFVDTPSYTLPSRAFPKMPTEGRHYSFEEIELLNEYAKEKCIEIIPEIEVPGHAKSMIIAYPELFDLVPITEGKEDDYALFFSNIKRNIINVGKPGIMDTLRTLADEVIAMFPNSHYLHIGGDEAAIGEWANCADCVKYMEENGIDGPRPLYTEFVKRMTDMVLEMGKTPIVWEGFPKEGSETISKDVIVTAWESYYQIAPDLLSGGFTITNASWQPLYAVPKGVKKFLPEGRWSPEEVLDWNIYTWKNWNPKTAAYEKPIIVEPTDKVIGGTFCAWEDDYNGEIDVVRENLAAMSEKVWNINSDMTHAELNTALEKLLPMAKKITV